MNDFWSDGVGKAVKWKMFIRGKNPKYATAGYLYLYGAMYVYIRRIAHVISLLIVETLGLRILGISLLWTIYHCFFYFTICILFFYRYMRYNTLA